jgi:anaerobic C4-dicarboxylate transporter DcuB
MDLTILLEAIVVVAFIFLGVRTGGVGLGAWGGAGTLVLIFGFGLKPGSPPVAAILVIVAVITAAAAMQTAGGIDWLVMIATRILEARPQSIVYVAPVVSFLFTLLAGTSNIFFPLIPVIYQLAYQNKIRPEKALAPSVTASALGITASPVSAAMAAMITLTGPAGFELAQVLTITIPASLVAILAFSLVQSRLGMSLEDDPEYQRRLAQGLIAPPDPAVLKKGSLPPTARNAALIFLGGVLVVVVYGLFKAQIVGVLESVGIRFADGPPDSTTMIQLVMLTVASLIILLTKIPVGDVPKAPLFASGMVAMIALFGLAWLADTFVAANNNAIVATLGDILKSSSNLVAVIAFTFAVFLVAALTTSQSGATRTVIPIGLVLGIPAQFLIAMWQAVVGVLFLPANGTQLAAVAIDETGSTRLGKAVVNHSFQPSVLIGTVVSVGVGLLVAMALYGATA